MKRNEKLVYATMYMSLENMLNERSQVIRGNIFYDSVDRKYPG